MAVTKILYRNGGLRQAIDYITNPVKTDENLLTDYSRCDPGHAAQQMMDTKRTLGKTAGRQCYHIIQSFKPDEITPELAHEIARQFAAEHLPGYEAVIATHVDKAHIHSHIVFNSVNAVTGKMYHSTRENYYKQIRGVSDRLCKAHGLSIVLKNDEKKAASYAEWLRQKKSQPTFRSMLEADLHDAIEDANDLGHFFLLMEHKGYEIHHGKRLGFRLRGQEHFLCPERRNPTFSEERIEQAILGNLEQIEVGRKPVFTPKPKLQPYHPHPKYTGFLALYFHYCYLLGRIEKRQYPPRMTPHLRKEIMKADVYKARLKFLQENNITTADDLTACLQQAENEVTQLAKQRTILNVRKKKHKKLFDALAAEAAFAGFEPRKAEYDDAKEVLDTCGIPREALLSEKADLYEQLAQVNQQIRQERWKLKQCKEISETAVIMQRDIDRVEQQPQRIADTHQR